MMNPQGVPVAPDLFGAINQAFHVTGGNRDLMSGPVYPFINSSAVLGPVDGAILAQIMGAHPSSFAGVPFGNGLFPSAAQPINPFSLAAADPLIPSAPAFQQVMPLPTTPGMFADQSVALPQGGGELSQADLVQTLVGLEHMARSERQKLNELVQFGMASGYGADLIALFSYQAMMEIQMRYDTISLLLAHYGQISAIDGNPHTISVQDLQAAASRDGNPMDLTPFDLTL